MSKEEEKALQDYASGRDVENMENYAIVFTRQTAPPIRLVVANSTGSQTQLKDPESGENIEFHFAIVTTLDDEGDQKLASMCMAMQNANVFFHTYDAKSGAPIRLTRIGATKTRLMDYAAATDYKIGFDPIKIEAACREIKLVLENPPGEGDKWYAPYEHLSGAYESSHAELYREFHDGDMLTNFQRLLSADTNLKGATKGCGFDIPELESKEKDNEFCLGVFVMHDTEKRDELAQKWMPLDWPWKLPLREIKKYFGEEIGFYFAFLGHITSGLLPVAVLGLVAQVVSWSLAAQHGGAMYAEAIFAVFAACAYGEILDKWRYKQNKTAHLWEVHGCRKTVPSRPGFRGVVMKNPTTGTMDIGYPRTKRALRENTSMLAVLFMTAILVATVVSIFVYKAILVRSNASQGELLLPSLLNSIQITVFGAIYKYVAEVLTNFENHKTVAEHNSALFQKFTSFYFINCYATLFYIAFVQHSLEGCNDVLSGSDYCGRELAVQLAVVFFVNDFFKRISNSIIVPQIMKRVSVYLQEKDKEVNVAQMGEVEKQFTFMHSYDPQISLVMDYIELFVQWGYLLLFGAACPLVAFFAFVTNFVETRTDGYKLLFDHRRVVPNRVDGIGEPLNIFITILYMSIFVNAGLIVFSFGSLDGWVSSKYHVAVFGGFIAFMFAVLHILSKIYPDIPRKTAIQVMREKVVYERVVKGLFDEDGYKLSFGEKDLGRKMSDVKREQREKQALDIPTVTKEEVTDEDMAVYSSRPKRPDMDMAPPTTPSKTIKRPPGLKI